jgi:transposase
MSGKSPVSANEDQLAALRALAGSRDRGEADRARAILLTLSGWTSPRIAEAFGVREDTVRLWRSDFANGGTEALKASVAPGPPAVKSETALRVVTPLLEEPVRRPAELDDGAHACRDRSTQGRVHQPLAAVQGVAKKSSVTGGRGTR